jgi:ribulose-5-phosphate 4-epimerase/fuculose-1-phosphate aldolase
MTTQDAQKIISDSWHYADQQGAGYQTWGKVELLQIAVRIDNDSFIYSKESVPLQNIASGDILSGSDKNSLFGKIFNKRKNIAVILITHQTYASQIKEEIPPILDDQAQLLGVTVRVAKRNEDVLYALKSRYAAILPNGNSICIGNNLEDAYVAAQLLEKTSKAFLEAKFLGGAKPINKIEAWLMQQFYQLKYSKAAKENK